MDNQYENQFSDNPQPTYVTYIPYGFTPETFEERKKVRKVANTIGFALLIVLAAGGLITPILRLVIGFFNLWGTSAIEFFTDPAFNKLINGVFSLLMFTIPFIMVFKISNIRISSLIKFKIPKKNKFIPYTLIGVGCCALANIAVSYLSYIFSIFGIEYNVDFGDNPEGFLGFMLTFIATAIIPPLVEEFACRGIILGSLRKYGDGFAVLASSIIFGILHKNFQQMPFAFLVGLSLGFVTVKTNSIWPAVLIHAVNNAVSVIFDYAFDNSQQTLQGIIYSAYLTVAILLALFGVYLLRNNKKAYTLKTKKTAAKKEQIFKWFFTSPTIIIFVVICVIASFEYFL